MKTHLEGQDPSSSLTIEGMKPGEGVSGAYGLNIFNPSSWSDPYKSALFPGDVVPNAGTLLGVVKEQIKVATKRYNEIRGESAASDEALKGSDSGIFSTPLRDFFGVGSPFAYWPNKLSTINNNRSIAGDPVDSWVFSKAKAASFASSKPPFSATRES